MIQFKDISVRFQPPKTKKSDLTIPAVKNVSFTVQSKEIFGIIGFSGAGKSTLLRTVNLLQPLSSGEISINQTRISDFKGEELRTLRQRIGMIFQHFNLAQNLTVYQNLAFVLRGKGKSKEDTRIRIEELLKLVGLEDKAHAYPGQLSGGQKQRVAIARALANQAEILLCDEPTSALDTESTTAIIQLLKNLRNQLNITIIVVTHELNTVKQLCDRVGVMAQGEMVEIDSVYHIFTKPQNQYTQQLIASSQTLDLPAELKENSQTLIFKLIFLGDKAKEPILNQVSLETGVQFNILLGKIEYIQDKPIGILYVNPIGNQEKIQECLDSLKQKIYGVEVVNNGEA